MSVLGRPRAILFDAVGTIMRPEPTVSGAYAAVGLRHGVAVDPSEVERRFHQAFARQDTIDRIERDNRTDQARERLRWGAIVDDVFGAIPQTEAIFADLWDHFADPNNWRLFDDVPNVWRQLTAAGVTLGVASNFDDRLAGICRALSPLEDARLFVSSQVGSRKPGRGFFTAIETALSLSSDELLLVGDDRTNDYEAAQAAGWQAILLDRHASAAPGARGPGVIDSLREVAEIVLHS